MGSGQEAVNAPLKRGTLSRPFFRPPWGDSRRIPGAETHTMPVDLEDAETGGIDLLFGDDLEGTKFQLREASVYEAEEVRDDVGGDVPKFGRWVPVSRDSGEGWAVALGELLEELQRYEAPEGDTYEVTRCEKSGSEQTDPYEVNLKAVEESAQTGLDVS